MSQASLPSKVTSKRKRPSKGEKGKAHNSSDLTRMRNAIRANKDGQLELDLSNQSLDKIPAAVFTLRELHVLDLTNNYIEELPAEIAGLKSINGLKINDNPLRLISHKIEEVNKLKTFTASRCQINRLPPSFFSLGQLTKVHLVDCNIKNLPPTILKLNKLREIDLSLNKRVALPLNMGGLANLKILRLQGCDIKTLAPGACHLKKLQVLDLRENRGIILPELMVNLASLKTLIIQACDLKVFPSVACNLKSLEELDISLNRGIVITEDIARLTKMKVLYLRDCFVREFPKGICKMSEIQELDLSGNEGIVLPEDIGNIKQLRIIRLRGCGLKELPAELCLLREIRELDLTENRGIVIPEEISQLSQMKLLSLAKCNVKSLPLGCCQLRELQSLFLGDNDGLLLPKQFSNLSNIKELCLCECDLKDFPMQICDLKQIQVVELSGNAGIIVPPQFASLKNTRTLRLSRCNLKELPMSVCHLPELKTLDLSHNKGIVVPQEIEGLKNLKILELSECNLRSLPLGCCWLDRLEELYLHGNQGIELSSDISNLSALKVLRVDECELAQLSPSICQLTQLQLLDLRRNAGIAIPEEIERLSRLRVLHVEECGISDCSPLCQLGDLQELYLEGNKELDLPAELANLSHLKILGLQHCGLSGVAPVCHLKELTELDLTGNSEISIPPEIAKLTHLRTLGLQGCNVTKLPPELFFLKELICLDLRQNRGVIIPRNISDLPQLKTLQLQHCNLTEFPIGLCKLKELRELDLEGNECQSLPADIANLKHVRSIHLENCGIKKLPNNICLLHELEELYLAGNTGIVVPNKLTSLTSMRKLSLLGCDLKKLSVGICQLSELEELDLSRNTGIGMPEEIINLTQIRVLKLEGCGITELPAGICELSSLQELHLGLNTGIIIPNEISNLKHTRVLSLRGCGIDYILPVGVTELKELQELDLSQNAGIQIPDEFRNLTCVKKLLLQDCEISKLPKGVCETKELQELHLRNNRNIVIPDEISNLRHMRVLVLADCDLDDIPLAICQLYNMIILNLEGNHLTKLPLDLLGLKHLAKLNLDNNPITQPSPDVTSRGVKQVFHYLKQVKRSKMLKRKKRNIFMLGNQNAGKSSLYHTLLTGYSQLTEEGSEGTLFLNRSCWSVKETLEFKLIDISGHPLYRLPCQLFMTNNSIYLVVFDLKAYDDEKYWEMIGFYLDLISDRVPSAVILVVASQVDLCSKEEVVSKVKNVSYHLREYSRKRSADIGSSVKRIQRALDNYSKPPIGNAFYGVSKKSLKEKLVSLQKIQTTQPTLLEEVSVVSCKTLQGITAMKRKLQDIERNFFSDKKIPELWFDFEEKLREKDSPILKRELHLQKLAKEIGLSGKSLDRALEHLHDIGEVLWYNTNPDHELADYVFTRPGYIALLLKGIFKHNLDKFLDYNNVVFQEVGEYSETSFEAARHAIRNFGYVSDRMLYCMWHGMNVRDDQLDAIVIVLEYQLYCYEVTKSDDALPLLSNEKGRVFHFPWLSRDESQDADISLMWPNKLAEDIEQLCMEYHFSQPFPPGLFHRTSVILQQLIDPHTRTENQEFVCGEIGEMKILLRRFANEKRKLSVCVCGEDVDALWKVVLKFSAELKQLLREWAGLRNDHYLQCSHCVKNGTSTNRIYLIRGEVVEQECPVGTTAIPCPNGQLGEEDTGFVEVCLVYPSGKVLRQITGGKQSEFREDSEENAEKKKTKADFNVLFVAHEWTSTISQSSALNREMAVNLAEDNRVRVFCFLPDFSPIEFEHARKNGVNLIKPYESKKSKKGSSQDSFRPHVVIGGFVLTGNALCAIQRKVRSCRRAEIFYSIEDFSEPIDEENNDLKVPEGSRKIADYTITIGDITSEKTDDDNIIISKKIGKTIFKMVPGIFTEFAEVLAKSFSDECVQILLFFYGDLSDFIPKGLKLIGVALKHLPSKYCLKIIGPPVENVYDFRKRFQIECGVTSREQLVFLPRAEDRIQLKRYFQAADIVINPALTKDFGLSALEAISSHRTILVTSHCGLAAALKELPNAEKECIIGEDAPRLWAKRIRELFEKRTPKERHEWCKTLRKHYSDKYGWKQTTSDLLDIIVRR